MADYGVHLTKYCDISNNALFSMYRREQWLQMDEKARQELLQETVNRAAKANGEKGACEVVFTDLGPTTAGVQSKNVIQLDRNRFVNDVVVQEYNGCEMKMQLPDSNIQALETVLHEDIHAWQNQCIDGTIECQDQQLLAEYKANNFDKTYVQLSNGTVALGQQYLSGETQNGGYYLYYLQSTERDAHRISEQRTQQIVMQLEQKYGGEPSFDAYKQSIAVNGYNATLESANAYFGAKTVEQDLNTTLQNQYYQTNQPIDCSAVEEAVKQEMVESLSRSMYAIQEQPQIQNQNSEYILEFSQQNEYDPLESMDVVEEIPDNGMQM